MRFLQISGKRALQCFVHSQSVASIEISTSIMTIDEQTGDEEEQHLRETSESLSVECVGFCKVVDKKWVASGGMDKTMKVTHLPSLSSRTYYPHVRCNR